MHGCSPHQDFVNSWVKSEIGTSPTGSEDYKLGESGCAKKRWLQQAISEQGKKYY